MTLKNNKEASPNNATWPSNSKRLAQWRAVAERTGNQRLLDTINLLEIQYANEATQPPMPPAKPAKGGDA